MTMPNSEQEMRDRARQVQKRVLDAYTRWVEDDIEEITIIRLLQTVVTLERADAIEECAKACDDLRANRPTTERGRLIAEECAIAIRAKLTPAPEAEKDGKAI